MTDDFNQQLKRLAFTKIDQIIQAFAGEIQTESVPVIQDPKKLSSDQLEIPYGKNMEPSFNGWEKSEWPWTGNGFTSPRNNEVIPEWKFSNYAYFDKGAELHKVINGEDNIIGIFDGESFIEFTE